ncbi:MAG TPA: division/cell wall cluster transcriptional repressor MraZ [Candidatus Saccharimonadales bacterium]|nr:division/cell wall cluster transcriptional repressor MraZ [Candidatus Saccharimonadales bacterium]
MRAVSSIQWRTKNPDLFDLNLFLGHYSHRLDQKNRVSIPKKFREQLLAGCIITRGLDGCLFLYSIEAWEKLSESIQRLPLTGADARAFSRYIFSAAEETTFDPLGRIKIPEYLLLYSKINKEVSIIGVGDRVEIWSRQKYELFSKKIEKSGEELAEKLSKEIN